MPRSPVRQRDSGLFGGESCTYQAVYRIADYELVLDHVRSTCGG